MGAALVWQLTVLGNTIAAGAKAVTDWGLSFGQPGDPPRGNLSAEELFPHNAVFMGQTGDKTLYLTFDAGYENGYTASILDTLKKHEVKAAFFLVGHYIKQNPELVKRMVEQGHIVGNHTATHPDMTGLNSAAFCAELDELAALYQSVTGQPMAQFYRPPQGRFTLSNLQAAKSHGYTTVLWSLAYADWDNDNQPSQQAAFDKLLPRTHNGAVVLLHSTSKTNAEILDQLITEWKRQGYSFGSLDDLCQAVF
ncbi:MAG: polysaccharide deacetylase family protein [Clostridia bacterium]|nr:polysaccharide deacetylase family protein [Clostridia bacterium]